MEAVMKILVINCGSSTIKYQVFDEKAELVLAKGIVARLGENGSYISQQTARGDYRKELPIPTHAEAFQLLVEALMDPSLGVLETAAEISAVGHRTVHGADMFIESSLITPQVIEKMEECVPLAPIHNPANLLGIRAAQQTFPDVPHIAVFDTSFHQTMPPKAYLYALPYEYYEQYKIRKYGFHGTSCRYVSMKAAHVLNRPLENLKLVVCHLGNGVTIAAVDGGKSVDTSIGFATFSGVMMGTRTGDIDPGLTFFLHKQLGMSLERIENMYYRESGLLGVSGCSNDMRVLVEEAAAGHQRCQLAIDMFAYRVRSYIGAYAAVMGGLDAIVFTAGIGENSPEIRQAVCEGLEFLGVALDQPRNEQIRAIECDLSRPDARTRVLVVPTNEEQMIAIDTIKIARLSRYGRTKILS
jgi:acetate kinase